jgi:hypothetical protein
VLDGNVHGGLPHPVTAVELRPVRHKQPAHVYVPVHGRDVYRVLVLCKAKVGLGHGGGEGGGCA